MTISPGIGAKRRHDVGAGLARDQEAAHRAGIADAQRRVAAQPLGRRAVRQVGPVALAGVDDRPAPHAEGLEQTPPSARSPAAALTSLPSAGAEAAGLDEVALHVDDDQRGCRDRR
jgi:hypothetical protein